MRVITTSVFYEVDHVVDVYYDAGNYKMDISGSIGVSFCWFKVDTSSGQYDKLENNVNNIKAFRNFIPVEDNISLVIDGFLRNTGSNYFSPEKNFVRNPGLVQDILSQDVVIERSPPSLINFGQAITKANASIIIGTYIGSAGINAYGPILFVSVPAGIIVAGSAIGIANALQTGLSAAVARIFK